MIKLLKGISSSIEHTCEIPLLISREIDKIIGRHDCRVQGNGQLALLLDSLPYHH